MFFRNLTLFRFSKSAAEVLGGSLATQLHDSLSTKPLRPVGPLELFSRGWVSPFGGDNEYLANPQGDFVLITMGGEDKILPSSVVNKAVAERAAKLAEERGKPVGGRERKRIKYEVLTDLLPQAFARPSRLSAYFDRKNGWAVIDTSSRKAAENLLTLFRETVESFPALPLDPAEAPRGLMTDWLSGWKLPEGFALGDECELKDPADQGAVWRGRHQDLSAAEVQEHLKAGKQCSKLGLVYDDRCSFTLGDDLVLRKFKFLDIVTEELERNERETAADELDARFALMTLTVEPLLERLDEIFKLPRPRERRT